MEDLLIQVENTLTETQQYVEAQQEARRLAEETAEKLAEQLHQLSATTHTETKYLEEIATLRARVLEKKAACVQLEQELAQEREAAAATLRAAVDKAVLDTMEHELLTREAKINDAVKLLRKVESKSNSASVVNASNCHNTTAGTRLNSLQVRFAAKEQELDRVQSELRGKNIKCQELEQTLVEARIQAKEDATARKVVLRKANKLEQKMQNLESNLEEKREVGLQLDQAKRELRLHKKQHKTKLKMAVEKLSGDHTEAVQSIREEHRRQINRIHRKKQQQDKADEATKQKGIAIEYVATSKSRRWSSEQRSVEALQQKLEQSHIEKNAKAKGKMKKGVQNKGVVQKHRSQHSQVLLMVGSALDVGKKSMAKLSPRKATAVPLLPPPLQMSVQSPTVTTGTEDDATTPVGFFDVDDDDEAEEVKDAEEAEEEVQETVDDLQSTNFDVGMGVEVDANVDHESDVGMGVDVNVDHESEQKQITEVDVLRNDADVDAGLESPSKTTTTKSRSAKIKGSLKKLSSGLGSVFSNKKKTQKSPKKKKSMKSKSSSSSSSSKRERSGTFEDLEAKLARLESMGR